MTQQAWTSAAASLLGGIALLAMASLAHARTPTPTAPPPATPIAVLRGRVFDAARGRSVPIPGARLEYTRLPIGVSGSTLTVPTGEFELTVSASDESVALRISADGFVPAALSYLPARGGTLEIGLDPVPASTAVRVIVVDPSFSLPAPIEGADVRYTVFTRAGTLDSNTLRTDAAGAVTFDVPFEAEYVIVQASAGGYASRISSHAAADLRQQGGTYVELDRVVVIERLVSGLVYDAGIGIDAPIADAEIRYERLSPLLPRVAGAVRSALDGRYSFTVEMAPETRLDITAEAPGYAARSVSRGSVYPNDPVDFALVRSGGVIGLQPSGPYPIIQCDGRVDVTITNLGAPGDSLTLVDIVFRHGYSQGDYGTGFTWDLSALALPAQLESGESLTIPVSYHAEPGDFDSRLHVDVDSGARAGTPAIVLHGQAGAPLGNPPQLSCGSPTPTQTAAPATPSRCAGDCDGNGLVSIGELVVGVRRALGATAAEECPAIDADGDFLVSIADLVTAVSHALAGCPPP